MFCMPFLTDERIEGSLGRHDICQIFYTSIFSGILKFTRRKSLFWQFSISNPRTRIITQFCPCRLISYFIIGYLDQKPKRYIHELFQKHIHIVKFYPSTGNFTQVLLVMLVTNLMSEPWMKDPMKQFSCSQRDCFTVSIKVGSKEIIYSYYHIQVIWISHYLS